MVGDRPRILSVRCGYESRITSHESRITALHGFIDPVSALALQFAYGAKHLGHIAGQRPGPLRRPGHEVEAATGTQVLPDVADQAAQRRLPRANRWVRHRGIEETAGDRSAPVALQHFDIAQAVELRV